ncbi:MAG: isoaspartyl peptidase/L-asparaginase [Acidobacteria bacterium]|nr:isoaspartyl peptidase/L-asparaginase [Acidobacteriota bacterium]
MRRHIREQLALALFIVLFLTAVPVQGQGGKAGQGSSKEGGRAAGAIIMTNQNFGFAIHGGAGTILKKNMSPEMEAAYRAKLREALLAGYNILKNDGNSLDAVEAAVRIMEDSPLFNAGIGAVLTSEGTAELDASIMDGKTLKAGAVASVKHLKNPISIARLVMEQSPHVLLTGEGAEAFAKGKGVELVPNEYFRTERRQQELQRAKEKERKEAEERKSGGQPQKMSRALDEAYADVTSYGTVGAVALDRHGNLAAATSTGGKTNKAVGRVGDSPIIGAGTYANNLTCAVSGTGDGEYFMRALAAYDISAMMEYQGKSLKESAQTVIEKIEKLGGTGGLIAIDRQGNITMPFNTEGMYRAAVGADGKVTIEIYKD